VNKIIKENMLENQREMETAFDEKVTIYNCMPSENLRFKPVHGYFAIPFSKEI